MPEKSFVKNAADPEQVKSANKKEKFKKHNESNDLLWVLSDIRGRRFVWRMLEGAYENGFVAGMQDLTSFNLGQKIKATTLLKEIMDAKPEAYITMMREADPGDEETTGEKDND